MGNILPHALFSCLETDLAGQISSSSFARIKEGEMWPGISFKEAACLSIHSSLLKKLSTGMTEATQAAALEKFLVVDSDCKKWELRLEQYGDDFLYGEFKDLLYRFWFPKLQPIVDHHHDILERGGLGPGSAVGAKGGDFYTKLFSSSLSSTSPSLYFWYKRYIRGFPEWHAGELTRHASFGDPLVVEGNRLDFVSKNDDISRTICVEPVLNMFFQLGFGHLLNSRLLAFSGIDLECQQFKNRELARIGSWDQKFSTIDLSSASDSISRRMLRKVLPKGFLNFLELYACTHAKLPNGRLHELGMISTMGNGFTFPLQTVLFTCVVLAAFKVSGIEPIYPRGIDVGNFGINGDDIVVPTEIAQKVLRLLTILGFTPNKQKTFVEGPFKESCGGDFFEGRNLRGVYIKDISSPQDAYSAINQLNLFSTRTGLLLPRTVQYLLGRVAYLPVPCWESDDAGIRMPSSMIRKFKLDKDTQSIQYYAYKPKIVAKIRIQDSMFHMPKSLKRRLFNPPGLHIAFLQGSIRNDTITVREDWVKYTKKRLIAPNWDNPPTVHPLAGWFNWKRWNTAVYLNLVG